jgi:hypothetical protein
MGFKSGPVTLGTTDTTIFECPATFEGACVLGIANIGSASRAYTLKFYKASTAQTTVIANAVSIAVNTTVKFPTPLSLEPGDIVSGLCAASATDIVVTPTITLGASTAAKGLTPRGEYSSIVTYAKNDLVSVSGVGSFISIVDDNIDNDPTLSPSAWMVNAPKGDTGAAGASGTAGLTVVRVVSTGSTSPSGGGFAAGATIDGVTLAQNDLVLRASATNPELNGVYIAPAAGAASRHANFATYDSHPGVVFSVIDGAANGDTLWSCTSSKGGTIDVTALSIGQAKSTIAATQAPGDKSTKIATTEYVDRKAGDSAILNGKIVASVSGNALTLAIKTASGNDPSSDDPVSVAVPSSSSTMGDVSILLLEAPHSLVISSGSTLGAANGTPFRLWIVGFDDSGTFRLGVINCRGPAGIFVIDSGDAASSTAEGGAGAADSAGAFYSGVAVTTKPYAILASIEYQSGLATAGAWSSGPTVIRLYTRGSLKPGDVKQSKTATSTTPTTHSSSSFTDTSVTITIGVQNPCNIIAGEWGGNMQIANFSGHYGVATAYRGSTQLGRIGVVSPQAASGAPIVPVSGKFTDFPGATGNTTYTVKTKAGSSGQNVTFPYNGGEPANGDIEVAEIIA